MEKSSQHVLSHQSVLVVDDNAINREFLRAVLDGQVAEIRLAQDGGAALEMVRDWRPDLVLMDLHMPGMDGLDTWRRMADELSPPPRAVVLTADWRPEERKRLLAGGFDAFLGKPVDADTLLNCLHALIEPGANPIDIDEQPQAIRLGINQPLLDNARAMAASHQDAQLLARLRKLLLNDLNTTITELDDKLGQGKWTDAQALVHRIKGSCGYAGATRLQAACGLLEKALAEQRPGAAYVRFARTLTRTRTALQRASEAP